LTSSLLLVRLTPALRGAFHRSRKRFETALGAAVPDGWPAFPEGMAPTSSKPPEEAEAWPSYLFVLTEPRRLVGNGGFVARPDTNGEVEIGYEIAPAFRCRGLATAAARALLAHAFADGEVTAVVAHTLAEPGPSDAVLRKIGMSKVGESIDTEVGVIWRWAIPRLAWTEREVHPAA
jgi:RimJ/RimL family protein N-acetyltransferase